MLLAILAFLLVGCRPDPPQALDLDGNPVNPFFNRAPAAVLLFVQTDCPISNRYAPTIARLHARFEPQGVAFYLVYPDRREDADAIRRHGRGIQICRAKLCGTCSTSSSKESARP